jgi:hypothetical protein
LVTTNKKIEYFQKKFQKLITSSKGFQIECLKGPFYRPWKELFNFISNASIKVGLTFEQAKNMMFDRQFW